MKYNTVIGTATELEGLQYYNITEGSVHFSRFCSEIQNAKKFIGAIHCAGRESRHCKISLVDVAWTHAYFFAIFSFAFLVVTALIRVATFLVFVAAVVDVLLDLTGVLFATSVRVTALVLLLATDVLHLVVLGLLLLLAALRGTAALLLLTAILDPLA